MEWNSQRSSRISKSQSGQFRCAGVLGASSQICHGEATHGCAGYGRLLLIAVDGGEHRGASRCIEYSVWGSAFSAFTSPEKRTKQWHPCNSICECSDPVPLWRRIQQIQMHLGPNQFKVKGKMEQNMGWCVFTANFNAKLEDVVRFEKPVSCTIRGQMLHNVTYVCCSCWCWESRFVSKHPKTRTATLVTFASAGRTGRSWSPGVSTQGPLRKSRPFSAMSWKPGSTPGDSHWIMGMESRKMSKGFKIFQNISRYCTYCTINKPKVKLWNCL